MPRCFFHPLSWFGGRPNHSEEALMWPYEPRPIDTSHVILSEEICQLTERLAENAHDH